MYEIPSLTTALDQGDIIDKCPVLSLETGNPPNLDVPATRSRSRVIVMTQACDIANVKSTRLLVAVVHSASELVRAGVLSEALVRDRVRRGQVFGWYFLPSGKSPVIFPESIVDLHDLHTINRTVLDHLIASNQRICRVGTPYREHLAQHFATTYSRIGLPEPYETEPI